MCKKLIYLFSFVLLLSVAGSTSADLVVHWRFDEGSGTTAYDSSGNGHDGEFVGTPEWVQGHNSPGAVHFVEEGQSVQYRLGADEVWPAGTVAMWVKPDVLGQAQYSSPFSGYNPSGTGFQIDTDGGDPGVYRTNPQTGNQFGPVTLEWVHLALTWEGGTSSYYYNGELATTGTFSNADTTFNKFDVGVNRNEVNSFIGIVDDFRIYDHVLSAVELLGAMTGQPWPYAFGPEPADSALHEDTWVNLAWMPGDLAVSHNVYLGESFDDVNSGAEGTFEGNQAGTALIVGFPGFPYPEGLVPGTTYYWRVDEVNDTEPNSPWKGDVWSFMVPPRTAYYPGPADGAEQVETDVELSWTGGFGARIHYVYFGDNFDDVNNATGALPNADTTYTPGTLDLAKTYYWRVDEFDAIETYKGHVWSFTTQGAVGNPAPANGAVDVKQTQIITWSHGVYADSHQVYFGTDKDAVKNADTSSLEYKGSGNLGAESFDPGKLQWNTTYYWRIDEANNVNPDSPWTGNIWSFTTANFLIVDDFESYNDLDPADPESNRIFNAWIDGYEDPANGSLVGYETPPFAEQTIVHGGNQSMPLFYDNSVGYSEATLTLTYPHDWTENGVSKLTMWFRGISDNAAETLYVALNGNTIVTNDSPDAAQTETWTQWNIDLQAFADQGVNLANVNSISLGLGNKNNPLAGGSGTIYIDDIRLYRPATEPAP